MRPPLVVFGEDWARHPSSTQHLVGRLARQRPVVWVDSIGMRRPRLSRADAARVVGKLASMLRPAEAPAPGERVALPEGLQRVSPRAVSWPGNPLAAAINRFVLGRQIREALASRGLARPILWTSLPTAAPVVGTLGERKVVYYCGDDFSALAGVDHRAVGAMEKALADKADLILAASPVLAARFPRDRTVLLPHGVDHGLFASPQPRPDDLQAGRVAGFYGSLSSWIDVDMLAKAAADLPQWTFALIGDIRTDVSVLQRLPNVRLLGVRPHAALPAYAQHWDVSLLPFRDCPQIRACNPLKLREYLAAGGPIATTDFPALAPYRDLVAVAEPDEPFARTILRAVDSAGDRTERQLRVKDENWDSRAASVAALLDAL